MHKNDKNIKQEEIIIHRVAQNMPKTGWLAGWWGLMVTYPQQPDPEDSSAEVVGT